MSKAYASTIVPAPADTVWAIIRDFDGLPTWHTGIAKSSIDDGLPPDRVGCIRTLVLQDGASIREKLLALSDVDRSMSYDFQASPFPVRDYEATLRVLPVTDGDASFVEWSATFTAAETDEAAMRDTFAKGVFQSGLDALKQHVANTRKA
ncbi:SRPBCC family protein [Lichenihabitans sp. PAMC28606]|uniref:SRPBCC family protein n=1 Tax=Lichenihabitans sp. PAMC28606 TaxID=2880932 RepID=UPI001D099F81|nr:SRPBCC family protein [Lichenihabitans sp. PAMC28606]UDL93786.1 SRPBCC family protein [Lichenihabitans sp. PAMC28606]